MNQFLQANGWEIARLTFEHLWLTLSAMLLAAAIGLPLGILLTRHARLAKPVIAVANIIQNVPSLALFGLLLPVPWLGENAHALITVTLSVFAPGLRAAVTSTRYGVCHTMPRGLPFTVPEARFFTSPRSSQSLAPDRTHAAGA